MPTSNNELRFNLQLYVLSTSILNCLILAAGKNTRLNTGIPKSLVKLDRESLMERHFRIFSKVGVKRFCVISGYGAEKINVEVPKIASKYDVELTILHNRQFDLENGLSVYRAKEWVEKNKITDFFLTMGDHVFDPDFVEEFVSNTSDQATILELAVDTPGERNKHIDLEDVTKVLVDQNGFIDSIGKGLSNYSHFDTGLFRLQSEIFETFSKSFESNQYTISDAVNQLISDKQAKVTVIDGFIWNDIDNRSDLQNTKKLLSKEKL